MFYNLDCYRVLFASVDSRQRWGESSRSRGQNTSRSWIRPWRPENHV